MLKQTCATDLRPTSSYLIPAPPTMMKVVPRPFVGKKNLCGQGQVARHPPQGRPCGQVTRHRRCDPARMHPTRRSNGAGKAPTPSGKGTIGFGSGMVPTSARPQTLLLLPPSGGHGASCLRSTTRAPSSSPGCGPRCLLFPVGAQLSKRGAFSAPLEPHAGCI
jgi:hypothetical protein